MSWFWVERSLRRPTVWGRFLWTPRFFVPTALTRASFLSARSVFVDCFDVALSRRLLVWENLERWVTRPARESKYDVQVGVGFGRHVPVIGPCPWGSWCSITETLRLGTRSSSSVWVWRSSLTSRRKMVPNFHLTQTHTQNVVIDISSNPMFLSHLFCFFSEYKGLYGWKHLKRSPFMCSSASERASFSRKTRVTSLRFSGDARRRWENSTSFRM